MLNTNYMIIKYMVALEHQSVDQYYYIINDLI